MPATCTLFTNRPEDPRLCRYLPLKHLTALFQITMILEFLRHFITSDGYWQYHFAFGIILTYAIISFVGYSFEVPCIMIAHFWSHVFLTMAHNFWLGCLSTIWYFGPIRRRVGDNVFTESVRGSTVLIAVIAFFFHITYTLMCYHLVKAVRHKPASLPSSYQFCNRNATNESYNY